MTIARPLPPCRAIDLLFRMAPDAAGEQERILAAAKRIEARRAQEAAASSKAQEAAGERGKQSEGPAVVRGEVFLFLFDLYAYCLILYRLHNLLLCCVCVSVALCEIDS